MVAVVFSFPQLVTGELDTNKAVNLDTIKLEAEQGSYGAVQDAPAPAVEVPAAPGQAAGAEPALTPESSGGATEEEDPMAAVLRAMEKDKKKKK
jgi:hypothetical protein